MRRERRNTSFIDRVLYSQMKRKGVRVSFIRPTEVLNLEAGSKTVDKQIFEVRKAILLPDSLDRRFVYDLTFIANNKNFTYGALFDTAARKIIVRKADLNGYVPQLDDYMLFESDRWNLVQIIKFEYNVGYLLVGQRVEGAHLGGAYNASARDRVLFGSAASSELNA